MFYLIEIAILFVVLGVLAAVVGLIVLHVAFALALVLRSPGKPACRYDDFIRRNISRRRVVITLGLVPFGLLVLLALTVVVEARYRTSHLRSSLGDATSMKVRTGGHCHRSPEHEIVLFETKEGRTIEDLLDRVSLFPSVPGTRCMCCGDMSFEFYEGSRMIESFSFHHGTHIRIQGDWYGDRDLSATSQQSLSAWLAQHGITAKLELLKESGRAGR